MYSKSGELPSACWGIPRGKGGNDMQHIQDVLKLNIPSKITNERQLILKDFVEAINKERIGTKYKPITGRAVAMKLSHVKTSDLYQFYSKCKNAKSFGKCFFGCLKI